MDIESNKYTIILVLVVLFLAWYYYQSSNESFKSQRGIIKPRRSQYIKQRGPNIIKSPQPIVVETPPPPKVVITPVVQAPTVVPVTSDEIDFSQLM